MPITWTEKTVPIDTLEPYERNPRRISKEAFANLKKSLTENGYHHRLICTIDNKIIGGHQRVQAMKSIGLKEVKILVPDRELTENEFKRLLIQDNLPFGEFDVDMLVNDFDADQLIGWGVPETLFKGFEEKPEKDKKENDFVGGDRHLLMVECQDEQALAALYERLSTEGLECKIIS